MMKRSENGAQKKTALSLAPFLQRKCACGQHTIAGSECAECRKKSDTTLQRPAVNRGPTNEVPPIVYDVLRSPGQPLDAATRAFFEPLFGHDFSRVRVHTDAMRVGQYGLTVGPARDLYEQEADRVAEGVVRMSQPRVGNGSKPRSTYDLSEVRVHTDARAAESARAVNALAYTVGQDIVCGAGQYAPGTLTGRRLLAHELTHVLQQRAGPPANRIMRVPHEADIKTEPPRYSFSTNCGWIDWGHTIPNLARELIGRVREASMRLRRSEESLAATDSPSIVEEQKCRSVYEPGEKERSATEPPTYTTLTRPGGTVEVQLGGFGVDSSDAAKFSPFIPVIAKFHTEQERLRKSRVAIEISGFTDCVGPERENVRLRVDRSAAMLLLLTGSGMSPVKIVFRAENQFIASNATRDGRRRNRGVLVRLVPAVKPEEVTTPAMESGMFGIVGNRAVLRTKINRALTEDEILNVSFSIFARLSIAFEATQKVTDRMVRSSFSEEDLPSNHISFYRAARGYSREEVEKICDAWDSKRSLEKIKGYQFRRNTTFFPPNLPPGGKWPAQFSTVKTIEPDTEGLYDIVEMFLQGLSDVPRGTGVRGCFRGGKEVPCEQK